MTKLQKLWDVITGKDEEKLARLLEGTKRRYEWYMDYRDEHEKGFEKFRDKIEKEGVRDEKGFYNYEGAMYCTQYPFVIKAFMGGKFQFYGIDLKSIYVDYADVSDMINFLNIYRSKILHYY